MHTEVNHDWWNFRACLLHTRSVSWVLTTPIVLFAGWKSSHAFICIFFHLGPLTVSCDFTPLAPCCLRSLTLKPPNPNLTSLESTKMLQTLKVSISFPTIFKFSRFRGTCSKTEKISSWLSYNWDACTGVSCSSSLNKIILFGYWYGQRMYTQHTHIPLSAPLLYATKINQLNRIITTLYEVVLGILVSTPIR